MRVKASRTIFLGVLPFVLLYVACSAPALEVSQEPIEARPSDKPISPVSSTPVRKEGDTMTTPSEEDPANTILPTVPANQAVDLSQPGLSYQSLILSSGAKVDFALLMPEGFDHNLPYPVLLALPPGPQSRDMVEAGLSSYWTPGSAGRDWIIVSPIAPRGQLFFKGAEQFLPEFLGILREQLPVEGNSFHLAGVSNGGISAFRIATQIPELFRSLVVLPGFPSGEDFSELENLRGLPVAMFVGEFDSTWVQEMDKTQQELIRLEVNSSLEIVPGDGHFISGLSGEQIFNLLDSYR